MHPQRAVLSTCLSGAVVCESTDEFQTSSNKRGPALIARRIRPERGDADKILNRYLFLRELFSVGVALNLSRPDCPDRVTSVASLWRSHP